MIVFLCSDRASYVTWRRVERGRRNCPDHRLMSERHATAATLALRLAASQAALLTLTPILASVAADFDVFDGNRRAAAHDLRPHRRRHGAPVGSRRRPNRPPGAAPGGARLSRRRHRGERHRAPLRRGRGRGSDRRGRGIDLRRCGRCGRRLEPPGRTFTRARGRAARAAAGLGLRHADRGRLVKRRGAGPGSPCRSCWGSPGW